MQVETVTWLAAYPNSDYGISKADIESIDPQSKTRDWQHMIISPTYKVWVATEAGSTVGYAAIQLGDNFNEIRSLYVLPVKQNNGIGTELATTVLDYLGADKPILLSIAVYNASAFDFYEALGFKVATSEPMGAYKLPNGKLIPTVVMKKLTDDTRSVLTEPELKFYSQTSVGLEYKLNRAQLASLSGLRPSTIKYYTEIGILPFKQAEDRLRRYYLREEALDRLHVIKDLKTQGYSIPEIQQRLNP